MEFELLGQFDTVPSSSEQKSHLSYIYMLLSSGT